MDVLLPVGVLIAALLTGAASYETYYLEDECLNGSVSFELSGTGQGSAALLRASQRTSYFMQLSCKFRVVAPTGHHVTLSVRQIDFRTNWDGSCIDYVVIKGQNFCKGFYREDEVQHFDSDDVTPTNVLEVFYHTTGDNVTLSGFVGFTFTVTAFRQGSAANDTFGCSNGHFVWQGLTCDGHNNCGDMTDEDRYGPANCYGGGGGGPGVLIILGLIIVVLLGLMCVATLVCSKNESVRRIRTRTLSFIRGRRGTRNSSST